MSVYSDDYIKHPDVVCCGDIIEYTYTICNESNYKQLDSKNRLVKEGQDATDIQGIFTHSDNGTITNLVVDKGTTSEDLTTWDIPLLRDGEQATVVVEFTVDNDCSEEFEVELNVDCFNLCLKKKVDPLTCCEIKRCAAKGELDCTKLTK